MSKKKTKEQFIQEAKTIHGDKYDYSLVEYINSHTKTVFICKRHNEKFYQTPNDHLHCSNGCNKCKNEVKRNNFSKTKEHFIQESKEKFGDVYDFSKTKYINNNTKVYIYCKKCNQELFIIPKDFLRRGHKCLVKKEEVVNKKEANRIKRQNSFLERLNKKYNNKFDTSEVYYTTNKDKVTLTCKDCGYKNKYRPDMLLATRTVRGCSECERLDKINRNKNTQEEFLKKAKNNTKLDLSKGKYIGSDKPYLAICKKCGYNFFIKSNRIILGQGCPKCNGRERTTEEAVKILKYIYKDQYDFSRFNYINSTKKSWVKCNKHNEWFLESFHSLKTNKKRKCCRKEWQSNANLYIKDLLDNWKIDNKPEYIFKDCKYIKDLKFDFYIPQKNIVIEYQGEWHYFDFKNNLKIQQIRDQIKRDYCKSHNITEIEIPYWDFNNIETILETKLNLNGEKI